MSIMSRIASKFSSSSRMESKVNPSRILPNRFTSGSGGFLQMGAVTRPLRQNTADELVKSIETYANIYEASAKSAEPKLIELAREYGVDLQKEAKRLGVDIFEAGKRKGTVEQDFEYVDKFTGEKKQVRRTLNLAEVAENAAVQKALGETNAQELRNFLAQTEGMSTEQLGVAHDIIDLGHMCAMLNTNISLQKIINNGKTIMGDILSKFPDLSRRNPGAIELLGKVFNHSDDTNSKFFLLNLVGNDFLRLTPLSEQMKALKELVPMVAKRTLGGGYLMDYSKENNFFRLITDLCRTDAKPENIRLIPKVLNLAENAPGKGVHSICGDEIALADPKRVSDNFKILPQLLENAGQKDQALDVSGFLAKNVNLD